MPIVVYVDYQTQMLILQVSKTDDCEIIFLLHFTLGASTILQLLLQLGNNCFFMAVCTNF